VSLERNDLPIGRLSGVPPQLAWPQRSSDSSLDVDRSSGLPSEVARDAPIARRRVAGSCQPSALQSGSTLKAAAAGHLPRSLGACATRDLGPVSGVGPMSSRCDRGLSSPTRLAGSGAAQRTAICPARANGETNFRPAPLQKPPISRGHDQLLPLALPAATMPVFMRTAPASPLYGYRFRLCAASAQASSDPTAAWC
jgi:hypothetical protein